MVASNSATRELTTEETAVIARHRRHRASSENPGTHLWFLLMTRIENAYRGSTRRGRAATKSETNTKNPLQKHVQKGLHRSTPPNAVISTDAEEAQRLRLVERSRQCVLLSYRYEAFSQFAARLLFQRSIVSI